MLKKTITLCLMMGCSVMSITYGQSIKHFNIKKNVAISGYDPVSYFDEKPMEGESKYSAVYNGIVYHFASANNKAKFEKSPNKYVPQYGGWCAYAMGVDGSKVKIDPETYKIVDGKLYLFYNFNFTNTLKSWNGDEQQLKIKADKYWAVLLE